MEEEGSRLSPVRILLLGKDGAGKTALLTEFLKINGADVVWPDPKSKEIIKQYRTTVNLGFRGGKVLAIFYDVGRGYNLVPLAGHVDGCVLVFDVNDEVESIQQLDRYRDRFMVDVGPADPGSFPFLVLANKVDIDGARKISTKEGQSYAQLKGDIPYYETTANPKTLAMEPEFVDLLVGAFHTILREAQKRAAAPIIEHEDQKERYDPIGQISRRPFGLSYLKKEVAIPAYEGSKFAWITQLYEAEEGVYGGGGGATDGVYLLDVRATSGATASPMTLAQGFFHVLACALWQMTLPGSLLEQELLDFALVPSAERTNQHRVLVALRNALHGSASWMAVPLQTTALGGFLDPKFPAKALTKAFEPTNENSMTGAATLAHTLDSLLFQINRGLSSRISSYITTAPGKHETGHLLCSPALPNGYVVQHTDSAFATLAEKPAEFDNSLAVEIFFVADANSLGRFIGFSPFPAGRKLVTAEDGIGSGDAPAPKKTSPYDYNKPVQRPNQRGRGITNVRSGVRARAYGRGRGR